MKYQPSLPEENDNISWEHPLKEFFILTAGLIALFAGTYLLLGLLVDIVASRISYDTESTLFSVIKSHYQFNTEDDSLQEKEKIQEIVDNLQKCTDIPYPITVHMVKSEDANAFALPGGNIVVFSGLLSAVAEENGLAFVLAHELGHFTGRDHLRGLGRGLVLYSLSAVLTGGDSSLSTLLAPSLGITSASYSQARESRADKVALDTLYCQAGNIKGATAFFEYMLGKETAAEFKLFHHFSSHPQTKKRLEELEEYAIQQGYPLR